METAGLSSTFGTEIRGVDLSRRLDDPSFVELERLFDANALLLFRNQDFDYEQGYELICRFGPAVEGITVVTNEAATGRGELQFHSERSFQREQPLRGLALYAREVQATGGATLFVNCSLAYRELPEHLRDELHDADTIHWYDPQVRLGDAYGGTGTPKGGWQTIHPAILRHPVTGTPILYVSPWFTTAIVGREHEQGNGSLLARLLEHLHDPAFLYRHEWRRGDLVLWDNFSLIHAREPHDESRTRVLWKYEFGLPAGVGVAGPHSSIAG